MRHFLKKLIASEIFEAVIYRNADVYKHVACTWSINFNQWIAVLCHKFTCGNSNELGSVWIPCIASCRLNDVGLQCHVPPSKNGWRTTTISCGGKMCISTGQNYIFRWGHILIRKAGLKSLSAPRKPIQRKLCRHEEESAPVANSPIHRV